MGSSSQHDPISASGSLECADGSRTSINKWNKITSTNSWKWCLGLIYIVAVAGIGIAASYIVQSVVDASISPFLITYICNSLFVVYIPIVEAARYFEDSIGDFWTKLKFKDAESLQQASDLESVNLLQSGGHEINVVSDQSETGLSEDTSVPDTSFRAQTEPSVVACGKGLDAKGWWMRSRVAKVSMLISPFWFLAQLTFNLSLRYTTVTVSVTKKSRMASISSLSPLATNMVCAASDPSATLPFSCSQACCVRTTPLTLVFYTLISSYLGSVHWVLVFYALISSYLGSVH